MSTLLYKKQPLLPSLFDTDKKNKEKTILPVNLIALPQIKDCLDERGNFSLNLLWQALAERPYLALNQVEVLVSELSDQETAPLHETVHFFALLLNFSNSNFNQVQDLYLNARYAYEQMFYLLLAADLAPKPIQLLDFLKKALSKKKIHGRI